MEQYFFHLHHYNFINLCIRRKELKIPLIAYMYQWKEFFAFNREDNVL